MEGVSVIVVSHNNKDILPNCLDSIKKQSYKKIKIYVIDNDSMDSTEEFIHEKYPDVFFKSISAGVDKKRNFGISQSDTKYIITLDSDISLEKEWVKKAVKYMDEHEDVGICCGKMYNREGKVDYAGSIVARNGGGGDIGHGEEDREEFRTFKRISGMTTACAIIRRKMVEKIGGFDENYYYGYEDTDFGLRANFAGWKVVYNPELTAIHAYHSTVWKNEGKNRYKAKKSKMVFYISRNRIVTFLKNFDRDTILWNLPNLFAAAMYDLRNQNKMEMINSYFWTIINFRKILKWRKSNLKFKKISDKELFGIIDFPAKVSAKNRGLSLFLRKIKTTGVRNLFFFITTRCNSRCKHCFYWKSLSKNKDLSLEQIEKILSKFYNVKTVCISGGEPFIRDDLDKIIELIAKYNDAEFIFIPTNCLLNVSERFEKILKKNKRIKFIICASIDGVKKEHEDIRGPGFEKVVSEINKLAELRKKYPNFVSLVANSVLTNRNYEHLEEFINFVKKLPVDDHSFDIIRGDHKEIIGPPTKEQLKKISRLRYNTRKFYNKRRGFLRRIYLNMKDKDFIKTHIKILEGKKWNFKCNAGSTDLVIESDGSMRICELQPKVGNLLEHSPEELLKNEESRKILSRIEKHECDCTHVCFLASAMDRSMKNIFWDRPLGWIWPLPK